MHDFQHAFHTLFVSTVIWTFCDLQTGGIQIKDKAFAEKGEERWQWYFVWTQVNDLRPAPHGA